MARVRVLVVPAGLGDMDLLSGVVDLALGELGRLGVADLIVSLESLVLPLSLVDLDRLQYRAVDVNRYIHSMFREYVGRGRYVVAVVAGDAYVEGLNFVFGLATPALGVASVYTSRLESPRRDLFIERLAKEVVHEIGHLLGLGHCSNPSCVMSFSNSVGDVDRKGLSFCPACRAKLAGMLGSG